MNFQTSKNISKEKIAVIAFEYKTFSKAARSISEITPWKALGSDGIPGYLLCHCKLRFDEQLFNLACLIAKRKLTVRVFADDFALVAHSTKDLQTRMSQSYKVKKQIFH